MQHITIRDISKASGFSCATVSLALRDHPRISAATRKQVHETADSLGYRPNPMLAAHWAAVRSRRPADFQSVIAVLNDWDRPESWSQSIQIQPYIESVRRRAAELGYLVEEFSTGEGRATTAAVRIARIQALAKVFHSRGIQGIALITSAHPSDIIQSKELLKAFSMVFISSEYLSTSGTISGLRHIPFHQVGASPSSNMILLLEELAALGYRRPGYWVNEWTEVRSSGCEAAAAFNFHTQSLPDADRIRVTWRNWKPAKSVLEHRKSFLSWLDENNPDVVIGGNFEVREWIESTGRRIPEDIGLAHVDLSAGEQGWAGIDQRNDRIASAGVDLLTALITRNERGQPEFIKMMRISGEWVHGTTVRGKPLPPPECKAKVGPRAKKRVISSL